MFQLLTAEDTVILEPHELDDIENALLSRLSLRYLKKVIQSEGPCLSITNLKVLDKIVIHSEGNIQAECQFDCLVFKPLVGSLLKGTLVSQSEDEGLLLAVFD